ncbi:MAG: hypothetical protein KGJ55_00635 [Gammaproteobacteria bacterium]|nr:hypothetical protein [Gammaproteobacteria bacterium]
MKRILLILCAALLPLAATAHTRVFVGINSGGYAAPGYYGYGGYHGPQFGFAVHSRHFGFGYSGLLPGYYYAPPPAYYYAPPPVVVVEPPPVVIYRDRDCYWRDGVQYCYEN